MIVKIALPLILAFIMFSLGLGLTKKDFTRVLRFPKAFTVGLVNQLLLLPIIAFIITKSFGFEGELAVGIMILAFCPGGVTTNVLTKFVRGNVPLSISMTAVTSLLSIFTVPILVTFSITHFMGADAPEIDITKLGIQMFLITALPVCIGMFTTKMAPNFVEKVSKPFGKASMILFALIVLAALAKNWEVVWSNLPTLGPALVTLNVLLLTIGYFSYKMVGSSKEDAATIAIETGIQNGTLGIAVGALIATSAATLPPTTVPAAVYSITMYIVSIPVLFRLRKIIRSQF